MPRVGLFAAGSERLVGCFLPERGCLIGERLLLLIVIVQDEEARVPIVCDQGLGVMIRFIYNLILRLNAFCWLRLVPIS